MQKIILIFTLLVLVSCNIFKPSSEIIYKQNDKLESYWEILSQNWVMANDILEGEGTNMDWGVLLSKDSLPGNYAIELDVNMVTESLFELMLNIDEDKYVRLYLYEIEQSAKVGRGEFSPVAEGRPGGGPTILSEPVEIKNNTWYRLNIHSKSKHLVLKLNDKKIIEYSLTNDNLSAKGKLGLLTNGKVLIKNLQIKKIK